MSKGSRFIFRLSRLMEKFEYAVEPAIKYSEYTKLDEQDKLVYLKINKDVEKDYKLYVLPLEETLKNLELYTEECGEFILRVLSLPHSFIAKPTGEVRKSLIIKSLGLEQEFKFLNNSKNFCAVSGPYIECKGCQKRGSLCDYHFDYGRQTGGKHITSGDINPNKNKKKIICENCNKEKPYYTLNICEECFDDEVDKLYSDDGYDGE